MDYEYNQASGLEAAIKAISQGTQHLDPDEQDEILMQVINGHTALDLPYLRALYFPEASPAARIPTKFPVPTGVITQKFSFYLNTGSLGSGYVAMCPQDTTFYPCFFSTNLQNTPQSALGEGNTFSFIGETSNYISTNFSHGRLVGASMQISWIGQADQESGFLCSSHLFDTQPPCLNENIIEEGFYPVRAQPSKGIRLCYIPKDDSDMEFAQLNFQLQYQKGQSTDTETQHVYKQSEWFDGATVSGQTNAVGNSFLNDGTADLAPFMLDLASASATQVAWNMVPPLMSKAPSNYYGLHKNKGTYGNPNMMVCYWKGLPVSKDWLRVDVIRHFEVLPRQNVKDLIAVARTKPSQLTLKNVSNSANEVADLHNMTLDQLQARLKAGDTSAIPYFMSKALGGPKVGSSMPQDVNTSGLSQGSDMRLRNATNSGLQIASGLLSFLPSAWLDKPLLRLIQKGVDYGLARANRAAVQGGGNNIISSGTPGYTRLVLQ